MLGEADLRHIKRALEDILGFEASCRHYVIDPLHGSIPLTSIESRVLQTSVFQRLRNIKQLGFVSSLYPGANHSRYEHSVGTLHTTWEFFKRFITNTTSHNRWLGKFKLSSFNVKLTLQALRLAGLLHDLGHGPYSHTLETILDDYLPKTVDHESLTLYMLSHGLDEKIRPASSGVIEGLIRLAEKGRDWVGVQAHREELASVINNRKLQRQILMILNKDLEFLDINPSKRFAQVRIFLNELIAGDVGSDRIDYLLRDTYFTGLGHRFSLSQIFQSIVGIFDTQEGFLRFAINADNRNAVEFLLITRYYHYRLIAHNPRNLDQEVRFKCRIRKDVLRSPMELLKLATLDEYGIRKYLRPTVKNHVRVFTSDLRDINPSIFRFLFYRVADDRNLRKKYIWRIKRNIVNRVKQSNPRSKLERDDIFIEITLEKPHIPLLHVYRDKYEVEQTESIEYHSILFHDWSDIVMALARTYLLDSLFMVYVPKRFEDEVTKVLSLSRSFYLSETLFKELLRRNPEKNSIHRLDVLLSALYKATNSGSERVLRIMSFFRRVDEIQKKLGVSEYKLEKCYSAEDQKSFEYCQRALNDLFVFEISEAVGIDIKYMPSIWRKNKREWKQKYIITPMDPQRNFSSATLSLQRILDYYPKKIRLLLTT